MKLGRDLCACLHDQESVLLNKPIATGFAVLEESKLLMYRFHYDVMIPLFGWENLNVCMTDTDSLVPANEDTWYIVLLRDPVEWIPCFWEGMHCRRSYLWTFAMRQRGHEGGGVCCYVQHRQGKCLTLLLNFYAARGN